MEEVVFFSFEDAKSLLTDPRSGVKIKSLIENEKLEILANKNLSAIDFDDENVVLDGVIVPKSATFIYYPWKKTILVTHGKGIFNSLKYTRNNYKINASEQAFLLERNVGVVGLSVGCSIVKTLVMEGLCGKLRISDFDTLDISNTNRIDWGVFDIGMTKIELLYRWIKESNPFIEVEVFEKGIDENNVAHFFEPNSKCLDIVIDECDSLRTKIILRQYAKQMRIPLVMHTSDRGMLDIENYRLESDFKSYLHDFEDYSEEELQLNMAKIISEFCELKFASERAVYSFMEIGRSISSWPQLAEDVVSGAGNTANVVRRLLLGENLSSQRAYINCDKLKKA